VLSLEVPVDVHLALLREGARLPVLYQLREGLDLVFQGFDELFDFGDLGLECSVPLRVIWTNELRTVVPNIQLGDLTILQTA
jgi:hypothetical protein